MLENTVVEIAPTVVSTEIQENTDLAITVNKREFSVVGDGAYIKTTSDGAPQWLVDLIDIKIDSLLTGKLSALDDLNSNVQAALAKLEVAKNDYTVSINKLETAEGNMLTYAETLNATVGSSVAQAIDLINTKVSETRAETLAVEQITASLNSGAIHSAITNVETAVATAQGSFNTSFEALETAFLNEDTGLVAKSEAMSGALTSAGIDPETGDVSTTGNIFNTLKSTLGDGSATALSDLKTFIGYNSTNATNHTGLTAYMTDSTGKLAGGDSEVTNGVWYDGTTAKSKWEYNSDIVVGGQTYKSGFGLTTTAVGSEATSEFWINADKFKMTNNTGATPNSTPVFSIDTTNGNKVQFNGIVTFSSVTGTPTHTTGTGDPTGTAVSGSTYTKTSTTPATVYVYNDGWKVTGTPGALTQSTLNTALADNTTVIDGGRITTGTIDAKRISTVGLIAENINGTLIEGKTITGAFITGAIIKASYLDLDGELEVLTNYHLWATQEQMDIGIANGQKGMLYTNSTKMPSAIYVAGSNEWRIPSISRIEVLNSSSTIPNYLHKPRYTGETNFGGYAVKSPQELFNIAVYPYNNYYSLSTLKFVKARPNTLTLDDTIIYSCSFSYNNMYYADIFPCTFSITAGNIILFTITLSVYGIAACGGRANYYRGVHCNINGRHSTDYKCVTGSHRDGSPAYPDFSISDTKSGFVCTVSYSSFSNIQISLKRPYNSEFSTDLTGNSGLVFKLDSGVAPAGDKYVGVGSINIPHIVVNNMV